MVAIHNFSATHDSTKKTLTILKNRLDECNIKSSLIFVFYGCHHNDQDIFDFVKDAFPNTPFLGGTSHSGIMCSGELLNNTSIGLLVIEDEEGSYGVASTTIGNDPAEAAKEALLEALKNANCPGELPQLVWVYQAPGNEEDVIAGLRSVLNENCPIIGGSSADEDITGQWRQLSPNGAIENGLVIGVLFPSGGIGYSFQGGYQPTGISGTVSSISKYNENSNTSREIIEIDGLSAAQVYNIWIDGKVSEELSNGGNILAKTTLHPLAIKAGTIRGVPQYLLIHPDAISTTGSLHTFAAIEEGMELHLMKGDENLLVERAGKVAEEAVSRLPNGIHAIAGGVMVYCAGCRMAVGEKMTEVAMNTAQSFYNSPYIGCFSFGEQGQLDGRNVHGNLMISAIVFGK